MKGSNAAVSGKSAGRSRRLLRLLPLLPRLEPLGNIEEAIGVPNADAKPERAHALRPPNSSIRRAQRVHSVISTKVGDRARMLRGIGPQCVSD
jgi:hypothetical protein